MAATAGATDPFQLGMVSIQNRISLTGKEIVTLDETSSSFILSAMARSNLAEVGSKDWVLLFIAVFRFALQIITQMNWLTQQGKAEVLTPPLVVHQGVVEAHALDAGAMEIRSLVYPVLVTIRLRQAGGRSKRVTSVIIRERFHSKCCFCSWLQIFYQQLPQVASRYVCMCTHRSSTFIEQWGRGDFSPCLASSCKWGFCFDAHEYRRHAPHRVHGANFCSTHPTCLQLIVQKQCAGQLYDFSHL